MSTISATRDSTARRLLRTLRHTWVETHDMLTRKRAREVSCAPGTIGDIPISEEVSLQTSQSQIDHDVGDSTPESHPPQLPETLSTDRLACPTLPTTPTLIKAYTGIMKYTQRLENLRKRKRQLNFKQIANECDLERIREALESSNTVESDRANNEANLRRLLVVEEKLRDMAKKLTSSVDHRKDCLLGAREDLEEELGNLLGPEIPVTAWAAGSSISEEDHPDVQISNLNAELSEPTEAHSPMKLSIKLETDPETGIKYAVAQNRVLARQQLGVRYQDFEWYFTSYEEQLEEFLQSGGEANMSKSEWQRQYVLVGGDHTRAVAAAEDAYSQAASEARRLGAIELSTNQSSRFPEDSVDGNEVDAEAQYSVVRTNVDAIKRWYEKIEEDTDSPVEVIEAEGLSQLGSVVVDESPHSHANGRLRKRIDRWNAERVRRWEEMLNQEFVRPAGKRKLSMLDAIEVHELADNEIDEAMT